MTDHTETPAPPCMHAVQEELLVTHPPGLLVNDACARAARALSAPCFLMKGVFSFARSAQAAANVSGPNMSTALGEAIEAAAISMQAVAFLTAQPHFV